MTTRTGADTVASSVVPPRAYEPGLWDELAKPSAEVDVAAAPLLAADAGVNLGTLLRALSPLSTQAHYAAAAMPATTARWNTRISQVPAGNLMGLAAQVNAVNPLALQV